MRQEEQKQISEDEVLALVEWDHWPRRKAEGGTDDFYNLWPLRKKDHREKTAKVDIPEIAKNKRITKKQEEFRARLLQKEPGKSAKKSSRWPKRTMQWRTKR